jgi:biopolymer transport protein ExbD
MAQLNVGGGAARRETNRELPLVPFIDFLLCLVSFLLITAVWTESSRVEANANVPSSQPCVEGKCKDQNPKRLHVEVRDKKFSLVWKQGSTVVASADVERKPVKTIDGTVRYPDLERRIGEEWQSQGVHRAPTDGVADEAVLHTSNTDEFGEVVAVIDAIGAQRRERRVGQASAMVPAFNVTFAAN